MVIVLKLGTTSIVDEDTQHLRLSILSQIVEAIASIKRSGYKVILVTSGAIGMGMRTMSMDKKPKHISPRQALAAIGQGRLMSCYDHLFSQLDMTIAQVLLTRHDIAERSRYLNACNTLQELLSMDVVPVINENDTVSIAELRFGDNDTLSAIVAGMVKAEWLFLLTDVDCVYSDNPRNNRDAKPVTEVRNITELMHSVNVSTSGSSLGTGGMTTKLIAAKLATAAGINCVVTSSRYPSRVLKIVQNANNNNKDKHDFLFTHFIPNSTPMVDRKWWILHGLHASGSLFIDNGAYYAIQKKNSLFAAGVVKVEGEFNDQEAVNLIVSETGNSVGIGIVNYSSDEIIKVKGAKSSEIRDILGYSDAECIIHRANIALSE